LVTMYQLASSIVSYAIALSGLLVSALMPAFSEMEALGERRKLIEAYLMSTKYLAFLIAPVFIFLVVSAGPVMRIWMEEGYEQAALIIQVLASAYLLNTIAQVASSICVAIDMPQLMAGGSIIIIVSNVILSIVCIKRFGFVGVAWGTMLSVNLGTAYFLIRLQRALKIPIRKLIYAIAPFIMMSLLPAAVVFILHSIMRNLGAGLSRGVSLMVLLIEGLAFICLYCVGVYAAKLFSINDIDFLSAKLPFIRFLAKQLPHNQKES
jgi:O-antigen/teichoic acid export membrane protein